jgi:hypothetical protein
MSPESRSGFAGAGIGETDSGGRGELRRGSTRA